MITVNGESMALDSSTDLYTWLETKGLAPDLVAVEYNGELLLREQFRDTLIKDGDVLEVARFVGGG